MGNNGNVTTLKDEIGVQREYRQVKRDAVVGERVLMLDYVHGKKGDVLTVREVQDFSGRVVVQFVGKPNGHGSPQFEQGRGDLYVVLEPTDVVVIDGVRYKTVQRQAEIGERVIVTNLTSKRDFNVGDVLTIVNRQDVIDGRQQYGVGKTFIIYGDEYIALEPLKTSTPETSCSPSALDQFVTALASLAADNVALKKRLTTMETFVAGHERQIGESQLKTTAHIKRITSVEKRVAALESPAPMNITMNVTGKFDSDDFFRHVAAASRKQTLSVVTPPTVKPNPPKLSRRDVIERAKRDVTELMARMANGQCESEGNDLFRYFTTKAKFIVDRDARTVTTYISGYYGDNCERARGVASCAPDDVFNVHIGKAIALRRALGLDVPTEYTKSPKPSAVGVGDIVTFNDHDAGKVLYRVDSLKTDGVNCTIMYNHSEFGSHDSIGCKAYGGDYSWARVVDDSRESASPVNSELAVSL